MAEFKAPAADSTETTLARKLSAEIGCAVVASFAVAPAISIIDRAIIANASGRQPMRQGVLEGFTALATRPHIFLRQPQVLLLWGVYAGTYITANCTETLCQWWNRPWFYPKFIASSITNITLSVGKDRIFTRWYGSHAQPRPIPFTSLGLFATRDALTVLAGLNLPRLIVEYVYPEPTPDRRWLEIGAQLTVPCAVQFLSAPMHLLALDLYNRPDAPSRSRVPSIQRYYWSTAWARVSRIFPAYGIGGVLNKALREHFVPK